MRVLVVEDDVDFADVLVRMLERNPELVVQTHHVATLAEAVGSFDDDGGVDVVLVDLELPDSNGLSSLRTILDARPAAAIVVMTGLRGQELAVESIQMGAEEYVVKDELTASLLLRTIRYAFERRDLREKLREAERRAERERELRRFERMAWIQQPTPETARLYGDASVKEHVDDRYEELVGEYQRLLDAAVEARAFKTDEAVDEDLRSLARVLGLLRARPRDVIELHTGAVRDRVDRSNIPLTQAYMEEGRLVLLGLMGHLASYYRDRAVEDRVGPEAEPPTQEAERS